MTYDDKWDRVRPLSAVEQCALLPLKEKWAAQGIPDRFWARIPVLLSDGVARMETLTVERVERFADDYQARRFSTEASMEPDQ